MTNKKPFFQESLASIVMAFISLAGWHCQGYHWPAARVAVCQASQGPDSQPRLPRSCILLNPPFRERILYSSWTTENGDTPGVSNATASRATSIA